MGRASSGADRLSVRAAGHRAVHRRRVEWRSRHLRRPGTSRALRTWDFPKNYPDPDGQTWDNPQIDGLYDPLTGAANPAVSLRPAIGTTTAEHHRLRSGTAAHVQSLARSELGDPDDVSAGVAHAEGERRFQNTVRGLRHKNGGTGRYPAEIFNINNAARNILEIMADQARNDNGDYKIRIYTIGMGELVQYMLGTMPEKPEDILKRMANDRRSPDFNGNQLEGKYYYAKTESDVAPAFAALQEQIVRLTK